MLSTEAMAILRCPEDRSPLSLAEESVVAQVNAGIAAGKLLNRAGKPVERPIEGGLVREKQDVLYPIVDQIPVLIIDDSIKLDQLDKAGPA